MALFHRITAWLVCTAILAGSLGIPVASVSVKSSAERYPCENCACGCADAESCWRSCCCHSNREKLVWAAENGVEPPPFVVMAALQEEKPRASSPSDKLPPCCVKRLAASRANPPCSQDKSDCCPSDPAAVPQGTEPNALASVNQSEVVESSHPRLAPSAKWEPKVLSPVPPPRESQTVLLVTVLKCRGLTLSVGSLPPSLPPQLDHLVFETQTPAGWVYLPAVLYDAPESWVPSPPPDFA